LADTAALVVALSAQLTKFEKDMRAAGIMAEKAVGDIEDKFSKMNPQVSTSFLGNLFSNLVTKGIDAAVKALGDFVDGFIALKKAADLAEISLAKVYGLSAALGGNQEQSAKSIEKLTIMLDEMRRGEETSFGALKNANPDFFKGMSKDSFDVAENAARVAEMVKQAGSEVEKWKIAEAAGFTRDMVKELEKGGEHFRKMTADNQAMGAALAQGAAQADVLKTALFEAAQNAFGLKTAMADFFKDSLMLLGGLLSGLQKFRELASNSWGAGGASGGIADPVIKDLETLEKKLNSAGKEAATFQERFTGIGQGTKTADPNKPLAHPALKGGGGGDTASAYDREVDALTKKVAVMEAETAAAGTSIENRAALTEQARLYAAAEKDGIVITEAYAREIEGLAGKYGQTAQAAADAAEKISQIKQAYQTVGSAVSTAFADAIVEGKKLNEVLDSLVKTLLKAAINTTIGNVFKGLMPGGNYGFAEGTNFAPGGLAMVGEKGPELVNLPRGSQVIPADVTRSAMSGQSIVYSPAIDARGASVEAVARLAQIMEQDRASFATRTVATIQQARRARLPGV